MISTFALVLPFLMPVMALFVLLGDTLPVWLWVALVMALPWAFSFLAGLVEESSKKTPLDRPPLALPPRAPVAPPAGSPCLLCARPARAGTSTCADHAALLGDRLGPSRPAGTRPGQLFGPGLIDGGGRPWRT